MREVEVVDSPGGGVGGIVLVLTLAEEDEFEAVAMAVGGMEIAGVIPPFGAEIRVLEMIARELVMVAGERLAVGRVQRRETAEEKAS